MTLDIAEVHDCFTISEIMEYEGLGFCEKGKGGKFIEDGEPYIGGKVAVNASGGLWVVVTRWRNFDLSYF